MSSQRSRAVGGFVTVEAHLVAMDRALKEHRLASLPTRPIKKGTRIGRNEPCQCALVRSTRGAVLTEPLAAYPDRTELLREYPELDDENIRQVLAYAATPLDDKVLKLPKSA